MAEPPAAPLSSSAPTWAFSPETDTFAPDALLDLRSLNERVAGEHGYVTVTPSGDFATGEGKSIRFWAVNEYVQEQDNDAMLAHKARWLAKRGVNMVRVHTQIASKDTVSTLTDVDHKAIERIWRLVAAMKKEGIYTTISPYWGVHVTAQPKWGITGMTGKEMPAVLFYDPALQQGYKAWLKALYGEKDPYTGGTLAQEPAVALIQIQNEDSMLFWTIDQVKGEALGLLRGVYGHWLKAKYGSLEKAEAAWGNTHPADGEFNDGQGDDPSQGRAGLYIAWFLTRDGHKQVPPGSYKAKRLADQLAFYAETMRAFNSEIGRYLRQDLGCKQKINAGNWRPADPALLFDAERYSYTANDVMGVNRYFSGSHEGKDNGWAIRPGDTFTNNTALLDPRGLPTTVKQPVGYPFVVSEMQWVAPSLYQSEGPLLTAAYESLTGVDIGYFFADGDVAEWQPPFMVAPWNPPMGKWQIATPMQLGQFPAAALLFRRGYLRRGAPVVHEERTVADIWQERSPLIAEEGGYDPNRDAGDLPARSPVRSGVDPLALLVGPVETVYGGDPAKNRVADLVPYLDTARKIVKSNTGEIRLNYGKGIAVIDAPCAQGATGFLSQSPGPIALTDVTIRSHDTYASVAVVAMDDRPIRTSRKVLVQVGTTQRPTGWQDTTIDGQSGPANTIRYRVVDSGKNPWQILKADLTLSVRNPTLRTAVVLDANGMPVRRIALRPTSGAVSLPFPPDALYVILQ